MDCVDIHHFRERHAMVLDSILKLKATPADRHLLLRFNDYCLSHQITKGKVMCYLHYLKHFVRLLGKPIKRATKTDIIRVINDVNDMAWSDETKKTFKTAVKRLYKIAYGMENLPTYPELVAWIPVKIKNPNRKYPDELLTNEEIDHMILSTPSIRNRAFLAVLAESGARIGEILTPSLKHICFEDENGISTARLMVKGKTGMRRILLVTSVPHLKEWVAEHPHSAELESPLWYSVVSPYGVLSYTKAVQVMKESAMLAGIKKRIYPHLFRHSRATILADYMSDPQLDEFFGWVPGSQMKRRYIHMSGKNTDDAIRRMHGLQPKSPTTIPINHI